MNCIRCEEEFDRITPAVAVAGVYETCRDYCSDCYDAVAEGAFERMCEDYYGGSSPQTDAERAEVERAQGVRS